MKEPEWEDIKANWPNLAEIALKRPNFQPQGKSKFQSGLTVDRTFFQCPSLLFSGCHRSDGEGVPRIRVRVPPGSPVHGGIPGQAHEVFRHRPRCHHQGPRQRHAPVHGLQLQVAEQVQVVAPVWVIYLLTCRSTHPIPAQLLRLHVVTPKAPLHVTLAPKIQPCPNGPIFHPGWGTESPEKPRKLPHNSCWVLRLPYIYCGENRFIVACGVTPFLHHLSQLFRRERRPHPAQGDAFGPNVRTPAEGRFCHDRGIRRNLAEHLSRRGTFHTFVSECGELAFRFVLLCRTCNY